MAQDDTEQRINGLMAAMGKKEQENNQLRAQLAQLTEQQGAPDGAALAPGAQWEPGTRLVVGDDGQLTEYQPPMPQSPNHTGGRFAPDPAKPNGEDDGSSEYARQQVFAALGAKPEPKGWTGR